MNDYIRNGAAYTAKVQQNTHQGYIFDGWYTDERCTLPYKDGTVLNTDTILYGKWTKDSETPNQPSKPEAPVTPNQPSTPDVPSSPSAQDQLPQTGDPMNSTLLISLMGLSLAGLLGSLVVAKKNNHHGKQMK
ncbi:InlB B-repeat-containing protein [Olsenella uli]|uniref:InlB B-repeat-containing protein n=1 Tax=Olsenella uli TaxID=133926 RepID=UPI003D78F6CE